MSLQVTPPDVRCGNNPHTDNTPAARGLTLGLIAELSCNLLDSRVLHAEDRHAELKAGTNPSFQNVPPCSSLWLTAVAVKYRAPGGARRNKTSTGSDPILGGRVTDLWIHWKGQEFSQLTFGQGVLGCAGGHLGDRWCFVGHTHTLPTPCKVVAGSVPKDGNRDSNDGSASTCQRPPLAPAVIGKESGSFGWVLGCAALLVGMKCTLAPVPQSFYIIRLPPWL